VDTGVLTPITLTVSPSLTNPDNPVDTGAAIAAQLAALGIPNVLLTDFLGVVNGLPGFARFAVGQYASITIEVDSACAVTIQHLDAEFGNALFQSAWNSLYSGQSITVPVIAPWVKISAGPIGVTANIYGTNRLTDTPLMSHYEAIRSAQTTGITAGVDQPLVPGGAGPNFTTYMQGQCEIVWDTSGGVTGLLMMVDRNNPTGVYVMDNTEAHTLSGGLHGTKLFMHPRCPVEWWFHPTITLAAQVLNFTIIPG
jgi:hypothetical protein